MNPAELVEKLAADDDIEKAFIVQTRKIEAQFKGKATNVVSTVLTIVDVNGFAVENVGRLVLTEGQITQFKPSVNQPYWAVKAVQDILEDENGTTQSTNG